jgi:thioredoxin-dependent peroxiredoxin
MMISGNRLPYFQLENQDGKTRTWKDYAGQWLVLYIYPKDDTPGCTIQGKSFTAEKAQFQKLGVNIVGLSQDDVKSHKDFCSKFSFTIDLLADPEAHLLSALGIGQSEYKGTKYWNRTTYLVDPKGMIKKVYENVKPEGHEALLLKEIQEFQSGKRVGAIPEGYATLTPYLSIKGASDALAFYQKAFGATEIFRMKHGDKIAHAEMQIGNSRFMLADENPQIGGKSPETLGGSSTGFMLYVEDCDQSYKQALAAGAKELRAPRNEFYGDRMATVKDPFGFSWHMGSHIEDVSPEELKKRSESAHS